MEFQLIRNATYKLKYAGKTFLIDPMLSEKAAMDPFASATRNPTVDLVISVDEIVSEVDCMIISHLHPDHYDPTAAKIIDKGVPVFCQPGCEDQLQSDGFKSVQVIEDSIYWGGVAITRTGGQHGHGDILEMLGPVSGFVFQAEGEPTLYMIGDSVWVEQVRLALRQHKPDVIITNSGGAMLPGVPDPILMEVSETMKVALTCPESKVIATHMESLDHCPVTRESLREAAIGANVGATRLLIPEDGEIIFL